VKVCSKQLRGKQPGRYRHSGKDDVTMDIERKRQESVH
jgi:hypothetical protein